MEEFHGNGSRTIFIGANAIDYSGYPDCRPEFLNAFEYAVNLGTKRGIENQTCKILAPLLNLHKADIIKTGMTLGVDYAQTISCYRTVCPVVGSGFMFKMPCFSRGRSEYDLLRAGGIGRRNREFKWAEQGVFSTEQGIFRRNRNIVLRF